MVALSKHWRPGREKVESRERIQSHDQLSYLHEKTYGLFEGFASEKQYVMHLES